MTHERAGQLTLDVSAQAEELAKQLKKCEHSLREMNDTIDRRTREDAHWKLPPIPDSNSTKRQPLQERPPITQDAVWKGWNAEGVHWFAQLTRSRIRAALDALTSLSELTKDPLFLPCILDHFSGTRQQKALKRAYFCTFPPPEPLREWALKHPQADLSWLRFPPQPRHLYEIGVRDSDFRLPHEAWKCTWMAEILASAKVEDFANLTEILGLIAFAKGDFEAGKTSGEIAALKVAYRWAEKHPAERTPIAGEAIKRFGDPFSENAHSRWSQVSDLLKKTKLWLVGQLLDLVFTHLVPKGEGWHQTEPRRQFWSEYSGNVERIWLALSPNLRERRNRKDLIELKERMSNALVDLDLEGGPEQAIVWMHLRDGEAKVTVAEGNANTTCRIRQGHQNPPAPRVLHYRDHILQNPMRWDDEIRHDSGWEHILRRALWTP